MVGHILGNFLVAAMKIAELGNAFDDCFAVETEEHPENAVRGRMLRVY